MPWTALSLIEPTALSQSHSRELPPCQQSRDREGAALADASGSFFRFWIRQSWATKDSTKVHDPHPSPLPSDGRGRRTALRPDLCRILCRFPPLSNPSTDFLLAF